MWDSRWHRELQLYLTCWRTELGRKSCVKWYTSVGTISSRGLELRIVPLTPCSADTLRWPTCLRALAELLHTLAPVRVSTSLLEMSPLTSMRTPPSSLVTSATLMSVLGSEYVRLPTKIASTPYFSPILRSACASSCRLPTCANSDSGDPSSTMRVPGC